MNLAKSFEFFNPEDCYETIHIIGCGAIGSTIAENMARLGLTKIVLYDFDTVEEKNIANQMFRFGDIGKQKVDAVKEIMCGINPEIERDIYLEPEGYTGQKLDGFVFLAVDNIELRRKIVEENQTNDSIIAMFDFRMGLTNAQHYSANWGDVKSIETLLNSMQWSQEEGDAETPISACNETLSVCPTIRTIVAYGIANFINFIQRTELKKMILIDAFDFTVDAF